ncbi:MAG: AAA family ATPase [Synergistaceae bacterium]|nr:AAA family ATPase [Synergistaceae bacterium]
MSAPVLTFFNNKGDIGKTSLIYHLSSMFAKLRKRVVVADFDPQANLTAAFLTEDQIDEVWNSSMAGSTVYQCVKPLSDVGDITRPVLRNVAAGLYLLPGDVALSHFEDTVSEEWPKSMADVNLYRPLRILTSFWQVMRMAAEEVQADMILADVGPNLGAINRSVLLATNFVAIPLGPDLFSLQGLRNLGPTLRRWRISWKKRLDNWKENPECTQYPDFQLPLGEMRPIGYLCQQYGVRLDRPVKAYDKWAERIPSVYRKDVLDEPPDEEKKIENDPYCLATIKHYRSLVPMGQERRKPIFELTSADGAIGSHAGAVQDARKDFERLAQKIAAEMNIS